MNEFFEKVFEMFWTRAVCARAAGGISMEDSMNGIPVPEGWKLDYLVSYYLPPNVYLL
jgi:hypothetical protein